MTFDEPGQKRLLAAYARMVTARAYRFMPNTSNDDDTRYRSREEVNEWRQRDPIARLRSRLGRVASAVEDRVSAEVAEAAKWAEAEPEAPQTVLSHTWADHNVPEPAWLTS